MIELSRSPIVSVRRMTDYLSDHLGESVTAYLSGLDSKDLVQAWRRGVANPSPEQAERLCVAYESALCLVEVCGDEMTRSWFFGMNRSLRETAPAYVLRHNSREDWDEVLLAARQFAEI